MHKTTALYLWSIILLCFVTVSQNLPAQNPIVSDIFTADPAAMVYNETVYLYTGHDEASIDDNTYKMNNWQCFSSTDMTNWISHGEIFNVGSVSWASGDAWAGEVEERNGTFYFYFCAEHKSIPGKAIGVAIADNPLGPFTDIGTPLIANNMTDFDSNWDDIDPTVFVDDDGQAYMFWGNSQCYYVRLNENMTEIEGSIVEVNPPLYTEAPYIHKKGSKYYLSYAYDWPKQIAYATSNSITGPWTFQGVINETSNGCNTNHQSIIEFKGKDYFFYHNAGLPTGGDYRRSVCAEYLYYNADGTIKPIVQTTEGVSEPSYTSFNGNMSWLQTHTWHGGHDPTFIRNENGTYTLLLTNNMLQVQQSTNMLNYSNKNRIFNSLPSWVSSEGISATDVWAPQITYRDGKYWCYYTVSSFGSNNSAIGLAVTNSLNVNSPDYGWEEKGMVFRSRSGNNYNAIDADVLEDKDGKLWMVFGSFWDGIKMIELDKTTGMRNSSNSTVYSLASRGGSGIEGPSVIEHKNEYFLFTAWDKCCDGTNSTYRTMVGKSTSMTGTFRDRNGASLKSGGGTQLLSGYGRYYGPGGGSAVKIDNRYYFIHHFYDANRNGAPGIQTREIVFDDDNWPHITQPFLGRHMSFEAEHAELINCEFTEGTGEVSGGEYVAYINYTDSRVIFHVNALQGGTYKLIVHYTAGDGDASHNVAVNDFQTTLHYKGTPQWGSFPEGQFAELNITLKKGYNRIAFAPNSGFAELDRIDLVKFANQVIEAGSFDGSNSPTLNESSNSIVLENGKWAQYENIHFSDGGFTNALLNFNGACNGTVKIALNDVNGTIQSSAEIAVSSGQASIPLSSEFQGVTGIYDVYVSSTGTCALHNFEFSKSPIADCHGDEEGSAYIDDCGTCVGGKTGLAACTTIQLEDACTYDGSVDSNNPGFNGSGFINLNNAIGSSMSIKITSAEAVEEEISIKYANGSSTTRPVQVILNGEEIVSSLEFPATGNWTTWQTVSLKLSLLTGTNELKFISTTADGAANLDELKASSNISLADCSDEVIVIQPIELKAGWNLIGYPHFESIGIGNAFPEIQQYVQVVKDTEGFWDASIPEYLTSLSKLELGKGYFIYVSEDCVLNW